MTVKSDILRFIMILPNVATTDNFLLKDLPGSGKRIDILCRSLQACFEWGPKTWNKNNLEFVAILGDRISLTFRNPSHKPQGEVGWARVIQEVLRNKRHDFVEYKNEDLESLVKRILALENSNLWILEEQGIEFQTISEKISGSQNSFMLGDNRGFNSSAYEVKRKYELNSISLGNTSYLGSHCIALVIAHLEKVKVNEHRRR